jgi:hypothetical protein
MKTLLKIFFLIAVFSLLAGFNKIDDFKATEELQLKNAQTNEVTLPFEVNLLGEITSLDSVTKECIDEDYAYHVIVESNGTATHMGKVSLTFDFCTAGPPDPTIPGCFYTYAASSSELIAANGDKLFLYNDGGSGILGRTDDHHEYVTDYWGGIQKITGGTGRFEGASGELLMDDYCTNIDDYTHHHWTGEITLAKGKK